ncbi:MAG: hypothetical protein WAL92_02760 [Thiogranum sp.]
MSFINRFIVCSFATTRYPGLMLFVLLNNRLLVCLQLFIARKLFSAQSLQGADVIGQLIQGNRHALRFTRCTGKAYYETLE